MSNFSGVREERYRAPLPPHSPPRFGTSPQFGLSTLRFEAWSVTHLCHSIPAEHSTHST